ncbi:MAG TPA: hypothetical protein VGP35_01600 [Terriglobales bacterium]|nr:hypothetical protein [Terriglobales bacterium]
MCIEPAGPRRATPIVVTVDYWLDELRIEARISESLKDGAARLQMYTVQSLDTDGAKSLVIEGFTFPIV